MDKPLAGMFAALMTAMDDRGEFDPVRQRALDDYVLRQGLTGLYVAGSSGESGLLESAALMELLEVVAGHAAGSGARLIAHVGMPSLGDSIRLARHAARLGYHALSALPPHSYPFCDDEIVSYYASLSDVTQLPLIVYEVPSRTGRPLALELLLRLLDLPKVAGVKFTSTDLMKFSMLLRRRPEKVFYFGFDEMFLSAAVTGADGGIGTSYNLLGKLYAEIDRCVRAGEYARARPLQDIGQRFVEILIDTGVFPGMKMAFRVHGIDVGPSRPPMQLRIDEATAEARFRAFLELPEVRPWLA